MHTEAFLYVDAHVGDLANTTGLVIECGSRIVNGTIRDLFPLADYCGVDSEPGLGVDLVADFRVVAFLEKADVVVCTEVLEHDRDPRSLVAKAYELLRPGGTFIMTCAGPGRAPHSAGDGHALRDGEHYANVDPDELERWLTEQGWTSWSVNQSGTDLRCTARR